MTKIRVVLVDDHNVVREGFRVLIQADASLEVVGEAENGRDAVSIVKKVHPEVAVLDISMPILGGVQATRQIHAFDPNIRVLILSMHKDEEYVREVFHAGATGYLLKQTSGAELIRAIKEVHRGNAYLSPSIAKHVVADYRGSVKNKRGIQSKTGLTQREVEVLQLIAEGYSNKKIAQELFISIKTVETHRQKIMDALDIHDVAGLTRFAVTNRIIDLR